MTQTSTSSTSPSEWLKDRKFGVVLDAGSSGTRIQVYSWKSFPSQLKHRLATHQRTNVLPRIQAGVQHGNQWQLKVEPGISSFGSHPHHLGRYLRPLLDHALKIIPADQISSTPFYLLATAGMRLLPQSQQDQILAEACSYIQTHYEFQIKDCKRQVRIISGEEEGIFGWISVNYLMDGFDVVDHPPHSPRTTFGFLDMGGASTQIAFEPNHLQRIEHADNLTNLTLRLLNGAQLNHSVFVTTWLGYGTNKAREKYSKKLVETHQTPLTHQARVIPDPCLPTALLLPSPSSKYQFNGTGDFKQCLKNVAPLLNKDGPCLDQPCLFDGKHVPLIDFSVNRFIGISEYWYSTQDLWSMGGIYDFVEFEKKAVSYCKQNWEQVIEDHKASHGSGGWPTEVELSRLESQCFKAAWIINILHEGIGFPRIIDKGGQGDRTSYNQEGIKKAAQKGLINNPPHFQSLNEVGNITVSWTLGKIVLELSQLPSSTSDDIAPSFVGEQVHSPQLGGLKGHFGTDAKSWFGPVSLLAIVFAAFGIWLLHSFIKTAIFYFRKESHVAQGYVLTSMEEGDASRRENLSLNRSRSPRSFRKPSLSSSRDFLPPPGSNSPSRWIHQTIAHAIGRWRFKKSTAAPLQRSLSMSRPNSPRSNRPSRMGSPHLSKYTENNNNPYQNSNVPMGGGAENENNVPQDSIIPPVSITTSLSAPAGGTGYQASTSARNSTDEGLFGSLPLSRAGSSNGTNAKAKRLHSDEWNHRNYPSIQPSHENDPNHLYPDRPVQRMVHSKSFQSLYDSATHSHPAPPLSNPNLHSITPPPPPSSTSSLNLASFPPKKSLDSHQFF